MHTAVFYSTFHFQQGINLYIKNLHYDIDEDYLKDVLFSEFGAIVSTKVLRRNGASRGVGFVCFSTPKEAQRAIQEMNGRKVKGRELVVELHKPKEY